MDNDRIVLANVKGQETHFVIYIAGNSMSPKKAFGPLDEADARRALRENFSVAAEKIDAMVVAARADPR